MTTGPAPPPNGPTGALARMVRACAEHPWRTISAWLVVIVLVVGASNAFGGKLINQFVVPGSDAQNAVNLLEERFPERAGDSTQIVFYSEDGFESAAARQDIRAAAEAAMGVPGVIGAGDPYSGQAGAISEDGTIAFVDVQFDTPAAEVETSSIDALEDDVRAAVGDSDLQVEFGGPVVDGKQESAHTSEMLGFAAAIVVLLIVLGTAVAMSIPITLALVSVGLGMSLLTLGAAFTDFNTITPILAVMIGLGVAIDYSLFIVTRFRQALSEGLRPVNAAVTAGATAGRAVIFAGLTVAISISGLMLIGLPFVTKLGLGTAITVVVAVFVAVTLLPAILAKVGHRIDRGRVPFLTRRRETADPEKGFVARLSRVVARHPKTAAIAVVGVLFTLAIPAASMQLGTADAGTDPPHTTTRKAYDLMAEGFGPGINGPLLVAVDQASDPEASDAPRGRLPGDARRRRRPRADRQRGRRHVPDRRLPGHLAAVHRDRGPRAHAAQRRHPAGPRRDRRRRLRGRQHRHQRGRRLPDRRPHVPVPALHRRHHLPDPDDGLPLHRDRDQGRGHDPALGRGRLRRARRRVRVARRRADSRAADLEGDLAVQDPERLVLVVVHVPGRLGAWRLGDLDDRHPPAGVGARRLDHGQAPAPPAGLSPVARDGNRIQPPLALARLHRLHQLPPVLALAGRSSRPSAISATNSAALFVLTPRVRRAL